LRSVWRWKAGMRHYLHLNFHRITFMIWDNKSRSFWL
jgi:hypothetical protein